MSGRPYRLALDVSALFGSNGRRGIGRYTEGLARAMAAIEPTATLLASPEHLDSTRAAELGLPLVPITDRVLHRLSADGPLVFHTGSLHEFPAAHRRLPAALADLDALTVATLYDAIPYVEPERYQTTPAQRRFYAAAAAEARSCDLLLAISDHSARTGASALAVAPQRIATIGTGIDGAFSPGVVRRRRDRPYVVAVTGADPRKNTVALISAFLTALDELGSDHQLVVVCHVDEATLGRWQAVAARRPGAVEFVGDVADTELVDLYRGAELSVFPSLSEGFGLPVAEAAACGCPTISSDRTSIPEVLDEPASLFDPTSEAAMASAIVRGLRDDALRTVLRTAGERARARWQWPQVAARALGAIDRLAAARIPSPTRTLGSGSTRANLSETPSHARRPAAPAGRPRSSGTHDTRARPNLAVVGPFGGSPSGIGDYNERLLPHLDRRCEVTCFVEATWGEAPLGTDGRRWPVAALGRHIAAHRFDDVLHTLGNSPFHLAGLRSLASHPGHVWFHEARLAELHIGTAHWLRDRDWAERYLTNRLIADIGAERVAELAGDEGWAGLLDVERYHRFGVRMLGDALSQARTVIVSSDVAAAIVADQGYTGPVLTLPLAFPAAPPASQPTSPVAEPAGPAEVAVLGWLSSAKGTERAVSLLARLAAQADVKMVFIGKALEGAAESVITAAAALGVEERVELTGYLPAADLAGRLGRCRAGLRLAERTDGEMSAAVLELVTAGVPTVTNLVTMTPDSPGLRVIPGTDDDRLVAALLPLLIDDEAHRAARADALARAAAWSFADVADRLCDWLDEHRAG